MSHNLYSEQKWMSECNCLNTGVHDADVHDVGVHDVGVHDVAGENVT